MAERPDRAMVTWAAPECPFVIECSSRALDDIRLAVNDAFYSLPRGGAEIGGILLGERRDSHLTITGCAALDCEHAMGPSFTLSLRDETKFEELIRAATGTGGLVVGWYHSHTRTSVSLSDTDLTIHNRFFPEPWQVALVVKPHTSEPMRGGFFFRGAGGIIHSGASYREFPIEPMPMHQVPRAVPIEPASQPQSRPAQAAGPIVDVRAEPEAAPVASAAAVFPASAPIIEMRAEPAATAEPEASIVDVPSEPAPQPEPAATVVAEAPEPEPAAPAQAAAAAPVPLPSMFESRREPTSRWLKALVAAGLAAGAGVALYVTRDAWYRAPAAPPHQAPVGDRLASIGLNTADSAGQLQIRWDANADAVRVATNASLEIGDGDSPRNIVPLGAGQLASGVFTYGRRNERVDVALELDQPGGKKVRQATSFLGQKTLAAAEPAESDQSKQEREESSRTVAGLRAQLEAERERGRKIEKELATVQAQLETERQHSRKVEKDLATASAPLEAERERSRKIEKELATARAELRAQQRRRLNNQALAPEQ